MNRVLKSAASAGSWHILNKNFLFREAGSSLIKLPGGVSGALFTSRSASYLITVGKNALALIG